MSGEVAALRTSVVVPTYNREALLVDTLESLAALDPLPDEVIVVSDGSTDGTDALVRSRGIRLLHTDRRGPGGARNAGWRAASGDVVAFLDDDCVASAHWLGALVTPFERQSVGVVRGRTLPAGPVGRHDRSIDVVTDKMLFESCNIAYRRAALVQVGGFDEVLFERLSRRMLGSGRGAHFGEDTHLGWQVLRRGWAHEVASTALVRHHVFPGNFADSLREEWRAGNFPLLVAEVPELRHLMPGGRWFLRRHGPLSQAALLGSVLELAGLRGAGMLALPYLTWLLTRHRGARAGQQALRDAVRSVALVVGSARAREIVL